MIHTCIKLSQIYKLYPYSVRFYMKPDTISIISGITEDLHYHRALSQIIYYPVFIGKGWNSLKKLMIWSDTTV